jgi:hypothetical protein
VAKASLTSKDYLLDDYRHTLFPLTSTPFLVSNFSEKLDDRVYKHILDPSDQDAHFLPQQRVYAAKKGYFLRRTVKLDPLAEYYLYDLVYRNRKSFRKDHRASRQSFGYRFKEGVAESPSEAYASFKSAIAKARKKYDNTISTDIATYFNSVYHHDLVNAARRLGWTDSDAESYGQFLREINAGRSVDCLPHGLHPAKVLGADFLSFVDNSHLMRSAQSLRFLDDIHLFDDSVDTLTDDLLELQGLLGAKGLSLNDAKTYIGNTVSNDLEDEVDEIKSDLLQIRRRLVIISGDIEEIEEAEEIPLTDQQVEYLLTLINSGDLEESDAELVLTLLRDHATDVLAQMIPVLHRFPGLTKNVYHFARTSSNLENLDELLLKFLKESGLATEYQLFWLAKLATDLLQKSKILGEILVAAYEHPNATVVSKAKILEFPDGRFGLSEMREEQLRSGRSDWQTWAAAVGTQNDDPATRNHLLGYFANGSSVNRVIADCMRAFAPSP